MGIANIRLLIYEASYMSLQIRTEPDVKCYLAIIHNAVPTSTIFIHNLSYIVTYLQAVRIQNRGECWCWGNEWSTWKRKYRIRHDSPINLWDHIDGKCLIGTGTGAAESGIHISNADPNPGWSF